MHKNIIEIYKKIKSNFKKKISYNFIKKLKMLKEINFNKFF